MRVHPYGHMRLEYFYVNTATGEKSGEMLAVAKFAAEENSED